MIGTQSILPGAVAAASLVGVLTLGSATQQAERYELTGEHVAVYNLAGEATIEAGSGQAVIVEVTLGGADGGELEVATGPLRGRETLRVIYPADEIVYARDGRRHGQTQLRVRDDGTFGDYEGGRGWRDRNRDRVEIHSSGRGLEAHADLRISVPRGQRISFYIGMGEVTVTNVDGELRVDGAATAVDASGTRGSLVVDVGSGQVNVTAADGDVDVDTGSGSVEVSDVNGDMLRVDTGSGHVTASRVAVMDLEIDTGSGGIDATGISASRVVLDTGSGSVDAELTGAVENIEVDTGSGSVTLYLPESFGARVEIDTGSGGIDLDFPLTVRRWERDHVTGTIGSGAGRLTVDTGSGDVRIRRS